MQIILVAILSWLAGVTAYVGTLALAYGDPFSWGDISAMLLWSALAFGITVFVLYLPALHVVRRVLHGVRPLWPFPLVAAAVGVIPAALIAFLNGGDMRSLLTQEASLFYVLFGVIGLVFGSGFAFVHRDKPDRRLFRRAARGRPERGGG